MFFEDKYEQYCKQLTKLGENKVLRSRPHVAMLVGSLANLKSHALSHDPLGDHLMPSTEVCIRAQAPHGNISVLSHLKFKCQEI